jgi:carbonic anhydrase/acetyltransferase-like protein (isoleucine patch superfamily)
VPLYALGDLEPTIDPTAFVHPEAVIIGDVTVGPESTIWPCAVLRGDHGYIRVGARTSVQDGAVVHCTEHTPTVIGDDCVIGHNAHLEGCTIEDKVLIGSQSTVLHHAVCRTGSLVGANALVPNRMEVPSGAMALGVPATVKPDRVTEEAILVGAAVYVENNHRYRKELRRLEP